MNQKQLKRNLNYFTKSDTPLFVGIGMLIVGVVLYFVTYSYVVYVIASVLAVAGLLLSLIGASRRVTDTDIDSCLSKACQGMEVDLVENPKFEKRMQRQIPPLHIQSYIFEDGLRCKSAKNGTVRSESYQASLIYALDDRLYIVERRVNLLSGQIDSEVKEILYGDIQGLEVVQIPKTVQIGKNTRNVTQSLLHINGKEPVDLPVHNTSEIDEFIGRVHRVLSLYKNNA